MLRSAEGNVFLASRLMRVLNVKCFRSIRIVLVSWDSPIYILGDAAKLKQVFTNLIRNACEAVDLGSTILWTMSLSPEQLCLSIQNGGDPIALDSLPKLTQPFYSTKVERTGLRLAIVKRIVEAHCGSLSITSSEPEGTIVQVQLPLQHQSYQTLVNQEA